MKRSYVEKISPEVLKTTADIIGPQSAAVAALEEAKNKYGGVENVDFYKTRGLVLVVPKRQTGRNKVF